jgi:hypothetical protein
MSIEKKVNYQMVYLVFCEKVKDKDNSKSYKGRVRHYISLPNPLKDRRKIVFKKYR